MVLFIEREKEMTNFDKFEIGNDRDLEMEDNFNKSKTQFTWRAAIVGSLLGCFIGASNLYLGLKTGWTFPAGIFGGAFSFILIKLSIKFIPTISPNFTIQENCTAQTAAATSGGLNVGFITSIPALYRLGLLSEDPTQDVVRLYLWTLAASTYGMFFSIPLRRWFVLRKDYPFPSPRAAAETIKLLHAASNKEEEKPNFIYNQALIMFGSFLTSVTVTITGHWIKLLDGIRLLYWIGYTTDSRFLISADISWKWYLSPSLALIGSGLIIPFNVALSFLLGSFLAFGLLGPILVYQGYLTGGLGLQFEGNGTAQALFLWCGITIMVFTSLTELILTIIPELKSTILMGFKKVRSLLTLKKSPSHPVETPSSKSYPLDSLDNPSSKSYPPDSLEIPSSRSYPLDSLDNPSSRSYPSDLVESSSSKVNSSKNHQLQPSNDQEIPNWFWIMGVIISLVGTCVIMNLSFSIPFYQSILSVLFAFLLGIIAIQSAAETDINPVSTLAKVVQLVFAFLPSPSLMDLQRSNLICACVTSSAAAQSVDMINDLKTGSLLTASPRSQFYAQLVGTIFGILYIVPLFLLYTTAYPCIIRELPDCEFGIAPVLAWQNTTVLLTQGLTLSSRSQLAILLSGLLAILLTLLKSSSLLIPPRYHPYFPNLHALGIGFILPHPATPLAITLGSLLNLLWKSRSPVTHRHYYLVMGAGFLAGEGVGATGRAILTIAKVVGGTVGWGSVP